jgi:predicted DCC family thiol-disulfide oxidoreductase YuxK
MSESPLMLYDGDCGLCSASVQFVLRHERRHTLRFAALESAVGREVRRRHPELARVDSVVWVEQPGNAGERVRVRAAAVLEAARYMGGPWRLAALARVVPARLRDALYDLVARHRHELFPQGTQCFVPPPAVRSRFLG